MPGFHHIAVASTFSPRFLPLLAEARRFAARFGCGFSVIHAGPREEKSETLFASAFRDFGFDPVPEVHWATGADPAEAIMAEAGKHGIDLLILGGLEKETPGRLFLGNVARAIIKSAPFSLLFLVKPRLEPLLLRKLVLVADPTEAARRGLQLARLLAGQDGPGELRVISVLTVFAQLRAEHGGEESPRHAEERRLEKFVESEGPYEIDVDVRCVEGTTGFSASEFVHDVGAELLIVPSAPPGAAHLFPPGMDWAFETIPTNLLVVRNRGEG